MNSSLDYKLKGYIGGAPKRNEMIIIITRQIVIVMVMQIIVIMIMIILIQIIVIILTISARASEQVPGAAPCKRNGRCS